MQDMKLDVLVAFFPYGGNGGFSSEVPQIRDWFARTAARANANPKIGRFMWANFSDTPITMTRNAAVEYAQQNKFDVLVMVDSDMVPDSRLGKDDNAKPFFESSFEFLYANYARGPHIIAAPYCGPPPYCNVYVFKTINHYNQEAGPIDADFKLEQFERSEAALRSGFEPVAALPTGLIMYDMRCWDHAVRPYFYYEYQGDGDACPHCGVRKPGQQTRKVSTEDVTCTRDLSWAIATKLGYNPLYCNWDAWAIHVKPMLVDKPMPVTSESVGHQIREALLADYRGDRRVFYGGDMHAPFAPASEPPEMNHPDAPKARINEART